MRMPTEQELHRLADEVRAKMTEPEAEERLREMRQRVSSFVSELAQKLVVDASEREIRVTL